MTRRPVTVSFALHVECSRRVNSCCLSSGAAVCFPSLPFVLCPHVRCAMMSLSFVIVIRCPLVFAPVLGVPTRRGSPSLLLCLVWMWKRWWRVGGGVAVAGGEEGEGRWSGWRVVGGGRRGMVRGECDEDDMGGEGEDRRRDNVSAGTRFRNFISRFPLPSGPCFVVQQHRHHSHLPSLFHIALLVVLFRFLFLFLSCSCSLPACHSILRSASVDQWS